MCSDEHKYVDISLLYLKCSQHHLQCTAIAAQDQQRGEEQLAEAKLGQNGADTGGERKHSKELAATTNISLSLMASSLIKMVHSRWILNA